MTPAKLRNCSGPGHRVEFAPRCSARRSHRPEQVAAACRTGSREPRKKPVEVFGSSNATSGPNWARRDKEQPCDRRLNTPRSFQRHRLARRAAQAALDGDVLRVRRPRELAGVLATTVV